MTLVVDASVAAKWVLPEPDSPRAEALRRIENELIAPVLILAEIGNAIWKRTRKQELTAARAVESIGTATALIDRLHGLEPLVARATEIAVSLDHSIYDCFYLALAERERVGLATADTRLASLARTLGSVRPLLLHDVKF
jgi:predicted nucleic acid-binding protein